MRILHLAHQYPPEYRGGTEFYTQTLARHQAEQGHEVSVFYPSPAAATGPAFVERDESGVRVFAAPAGERSRSEVFLSTWRQPTLASALAGILSRTRPELVHVQHLMGLPAAAAGQIRDAGLPYVVTLHDYWYVCANAQLLTNYDQTICAGPRAWINCGRCVLARAGFQRGQWLAPAVAPLLAHRALLLRRVVRQAAGLIAPTDFVRRVYGRLGIDERRVTVIPHGIDVPAFVQEAPRPDGPRQNGRLHVVYVGGIARQKGVHVLVEAANQLSARHFQFTILGDLSGEPAYAEPLQALSQTPALTFVGAVGREELWRMLAHEADVLVVPSLWYETAALVIQEAFAAGIPVVASRLGALAKRVQDEVDGLLFAPGDAAALRDQLLRLQSDSHLLRRLQAGIKPVRRIAEHAADIEQLYRRAQASRRGRAAAGSVMEE